MHKHKDNDGHWSGRKQQLPPIYEPVSFVYEPAEKHKNKKKSKWCKRSKGKHEFELKEKKEWWIYEVYEYRCKHCGKMSIKFEKNNL